MLCTSGVLSFSFELTMRKIFNKEGRHENDKTENIIQKNPKIRLLLFSEKTSRIIEKEIFFFLFVVKLIFGSTFIQS